MKSLVFAAADGMNYLPNSYPPQGGRALLLRFYNNFKETCLFVCQVLA